MEMKRDNELLKNKLAEAALMQKKLEQDIVRLQKVCRCHVRSTVNLVAVMLSNTGRCGLCVASLISTYITHPAGT